MSVRRNRSGRVWAGVASAVLAALLVSGCTPASPTATPLSPTRTPLPTAQPVTPSATLAPTATPTARPTATPTVQPTPTRDPSSAFSAPPLEPMGHARVMIPSAVGEFERLEDAPRYQIDGAYDAASSQVRGTERVRIVNRWDDPLEAVYFRLYPNAKSLYGPASMTLLGVADESGKSLDLGEEAKGTAVRVTLPSPLEPGAVAMLTVEWEAHVPSDIGREWTRADGFGLFREVNGLLVLANWFPMLALYDGATWRLDLPAAWGDPVYSEVAFYEVWFTAPSEYTLVTTGEQVWSGKQGGANRYAFLSGPARDFYLTLGKGLSFKQTTVGGTTVRSYFFEDDARAGEEALNAGADALRVFSRRFGTYPYDEFDLVETPLVGLLGMEYPGMVLLAETMYQGDQKWRLDITTAHEVSHQWWYGVVGNDIFREPWLDEAMATFCSGVYVQDVWPDGSFRTQRGEWVQRYEANGRGEITWPVWDFPSGWDYGSVVYYKGALFLQALREEIGDSAFFRALREYYDAHRFDIARGEDMLAAFERVSGRDLDGFYAHWLGQ